jgi:predicted alpha/beta-hydrolase family hydrolase
MGAASPDDDLLIDGPAGGRTLVLAHGAGAPMDSPFMERVAAGLAGRGLRVVRFEFDYMRRRRVDGSRGAPDRAPRLERRWVEIVERLGDPARLVIGGKSMGGRIASTVADGLGVRGLVCLGYPFHPAGKPQSLRTAHLRRLRTPTLIVQGTRDTLGSRAEIAGYELSPAVALHFLEDGDHSFKPRVRSGRTLEQNMEEALDVVAAFAAKSAC